MYIIWRDFTLEGRNRISHFCERFYFLRTGWQDNKVCRRNSLEHEEIFSVIIPKINSWLFLKFPKEQECKDIPKSREHKIKKKKKDLAAITYISVLTLNVYVLQKQVH
jgi:hypothetical protein